MQISRRTLLQAGAALGPMAAPAKSYAANDRVNFGVIGAGARAHELMAALVQHQGVEITAVVDAYRGRVERAIERTGGRARAVRDYRQLLAEKSIDAVLIVTPDHWHQQMIVDAVRAGKDVYCEKPMTYRSSDGIEILEAVRQTGRIVQIGSQGMSSARQRKAREMIQAGKLGKVTMIRATYNRNTASGAWLYPIPPDASPKTVDWEMFLGPAPKRPFDLARFFRWRCYSDYSGGIATDLFVHLCTTIHFLMDAKAPSKVLAMGQLYRWKESRDVPDTLNAILEYPEGFVVTLSSTFNNQGPSEDSYHVLGTEGTLSFGVNMVFAPQSAREDNRWIVESWPSALERAYYQDPKVQQSEMPSTWAPRVREAEQVFDEEGRDATFLHFGHLLDSIRTRRPYWQDALAGHRAAACAHMINRAARERKLVEWDFDKEDIQA